MLTILPDTDPILRKVAEQVTEQQFTNIPINDKLRRLTMDMLMTMKANNGIGLAAPQIGVSQRIIVVDFSPFALINPEIVSKTGSQWYNEGCLSFPGVFYDIKRANTVTVKYQTFSGETFHITESGLNAIVLQHEIDHLNGILFTDYVNDSLDVHNIQARHRPLGLNF